LEAHQTTALLLDSSVQLQGENLPKEVNVCDYKVPIGFGNKIQTALGTSGTGLKEKKELNLS